MDADWASAGALHFAGFTLDLSRGVLLAEGGAEVPLRPRSFALLRLLVLNAGRLLSRDAIMVAVWPDVVVTDQSITQCVRDVRKALDDETQRLLRTMPKRGYLLAAEVTWAGCTATPGAGRKPVNMPVAEIEGHARLPRPNEAGVPGRPTSYFHIAEHNLPQPNRAFVGRTAELQALGQALAKSDSTLSWPQAITGLGGVGKTQLVLHYAYAHLGDYDLVHWLHAEQPATLAAGYTALASAFGVNIEATDQLTAVAMIRARLETAGGWLLIFDNAPDPSALRDFLPRTGRIHVLITSRWQYWEGAAETIELGVFPEEDAIRLLLGVEHEEEDAVHREEASKLAIQLGWLPLALAQARAYTRRLKVDLATYGRRFAESREKVLAWRPRDAGYPLAVAQAWQASAAAAEGEHAGARPLLELLAFFAPDAIPRTVLRAAPDALPEPLRGDQDLDEAVAALNGLSLIRADPDRLTVHRLVQAVTRDVLAEATAAALVDASVRLVHAALPHPTTEPPNWLAVAALLPHVLATTKAAERLKTGLATTAAVLNEIALYHHARAAWAEAESLHRRALAIREKALGPEHPDVAQSLNNLAWLHQHTGRHTEAEGLHRRAIVIAENTLGPEHPDVAQSVSNLAWLLQHTGRHAEAELLHRRSIREKALGPEHPDVAQSLNNLAWLRQHTGRHAESEPLHRRALAIREKALGPEHPDVAQSLSNLAGLYRATGRHPEAEPLLLRALAIRERIFGPEHPSVVHSLNNLAWLHLHTGRHAEAEPLHRRALAIREKIFGPEHPSIALSLNDLALLYRAAGRDAEASPLLERALAIGEKTLGAGHPELATWLDDLARLYRGYGQAWDTGLRRRPDPRQPCAGDPGGERR
jgi:DNA-binding winged helix-turn-helix (wHTH) protein/tetratricopeptide (TPR) repeat protein